LAPYEVSQAHITDSDMLIWLINTVRQKYEKQASSRLSKIPARRLWIRNSSSFDHMGLLFLPTGKESSNA
jgi:hypothetical protein